MPEKLTKPEVWIVGPDPRGNVMVLERSHDLELIRNVKQRCGGHWDDDERPWNERSVDAFAVTAADRLRAAQHDRDEARLNLAEAYRIWDGPDTTDFCEGVCKEAAHQVARWGVSHEEGKGPFDWFWLLGYLVQKAAAAAQSGDLDGAKHHTISSAAALLNWHARLSGLASQMRPGIEPPKDEGIETTEVGPVEWKRKEPVDGDPWFEAFLGRGLLQVSVPCAPWVWEWSVTDHDDIEIARGELYVEHDDQDEDAWDYQGVELVQLRCEKVARALLTGPRCGASIDEE